MSEQFDLGIVEPPEDKLELRLSRNQKESVSTCEASMDNERSGARSYGGRPKADSVIELALKIKVKELQLRYRNLLIIMLFSLALFAFVACFGVYSYSRSQSKIERNFKDISNMITLAYRGDPVAHEEITRRIPLLTRSRLPKTLRSGDNESIEVIQNKLSASDIEPAQTSNIGEPESVFLYSKPSLDAINLGRINNDAEVIYIVNHGEWSSLMMASGIPVWIHSDLIDSIDSSLGEVNSNDASLRISPNMSDDTIVTHIQEGDKLQLIERQGDWLRVYTPADYSAWVKSAELRKIIQ